MAAQTQATDAVRDAASAAERLFAGPGEARALARKLDWASTPLGAVDTWPQSLRTAVDVCLGSHFPTALLWGPALVMIHNEGHIPILGARFPGAMGRPAPEVLSDSWPVLGPLVSSALSAGDGSGARDPVDIAVTFERGDGQRTGHLTVSIGALHDESGRPAGVMITAVDMTSRTLAEAAQRESERKYRTLFESIDQGCCLIELLYDAAGHAVDCRILEVNRAFMRHTGMPDPTGRLLSEVAPDTEALWLQTWEAVARTGEPVAFEAQHEGTGRWYHAFGTRIGGEDSRIVAMLATDITEAKHEEQVRAQNAERQAFLLTLSDALRPLADPIAIQVEAARVLGRHLGASRAMYSEVEADDAHFVVHRDYVDGAPSLAGRHLLDAFGPAFIRDHRAGRTLTMADATRDPRVGETRLAAFVAAGIGAFVGVPLVKGGRLAASLSVHFPLPHDWSPAEVALVEETAERTWAAVERARAEAASRASEVRFRAVADLVPDLLWESDPDGSTPWYNARWSEYTGQTSSQSHGWGWTDVIHPDDRARSTANYQRAIERGEPMMQEHRIRGHDGEYRWFLVRAEPLRDDAGRIVRWFGAATDIHAQRTALDVAERLAAERATEGVALRRQLLDAEEAERRRLARDLHDETGQHLTALGLGLQALSDVATPGSEVDRRLVQLHGLVATMSRELHALAVRLRPKALDDFGLEAALVTYTEEWSRQAGIGLDVHAQTGPERLPSAVESAVYRVVQEALTNVARHSGAARASVVVERRDGQVVAIVEDDGRGFVPDVLGRRVEEVPGLGLLGIRERASLLGGTADVESEPGRGTTIFVRIPVDR